MMKTQILKFWIYGGRANDLQRSKILVLLGKWLMSHESWRTQPTVSYFQVKGGFDLSEVGPIGCWHVACQWVHVLKKNLKREIKIDKIWLSIWFI